MFSACSICVLKTAPTPMKRPVHNTAEMISNAAKVRHRMPSAPAIGGATTEMPGTNLAAIREAPPQRVRRSSLCRTQVSGAKELRHRRRRTRWPKWRPAQNQAPSPSRLASRLASAAALHKSWWLAANAPATTSSGAAGTGAPSRATRVTAKISTRPCWTIKAISDCIPEHRLCLLLFGHEPPTNQRDRAADTGSNGRCGRTEGQGGALPVRIRKRQ